MYTESIHLHRYSCAEMICSERGVCVCMCVPEVGGGVGVERRLLQVKPFYLISHSMLLNKMDFFLLYT